MNLREGLVAELKRNRELLEEYKKIPQGKFGYLILKASIDQAETALASGDVVDMVVAYKQLKSNE